MASGSIRITNIPVTLGGTTYTLGATATWSSSRSGNTVTVSGKVTTDSTAGYINQMSSSYAVTCDIKFGSNSAKTITLKEGSHVDTILGIFANYKYSYTVGADTTQSTIRFTVNHAYNSGSGTGSGTVTYPVGYTAITAPSKIRPADIKCPWRQGVYKWVWTAGKAGTNNAIKTVQLQYKLYDSSKELWGDWKNLTTVSASQTSYEWTKKIDEGDALRLRIVTTPTQGDAVTTTEEPTWDNSNNLDYATYYQTENTAIGTPILSVTSPIAAGESPKITVSSTHGTVSPSLFSSNTKIGIGFTISRSDTGYSTGEIIVYGPIKGTKSYSITNWNNFPVGKSVTISAKVSDGWTNKTVTKTITCGKVLNAGQLSLSSDNNNTVPEDGKYENFVFTIRRPTVDNNLLLASDVNVTYTILGKYGGSTSDYQSIYSITQAYGSESSAAPTISLSKAEIVNKLKGVPTTLETPLIFIAQYSVTGFSTVNSNSVTGKIKWATAPGDLSISQWDDSNDKFYRNIGNSSPVAINNITINSLVSDYNYTINGILYTNTQGSIIFDITNFSEGEISLPCQVYEKIGNYIMLLKSYNISGVYKIINANNGNYNLNMTSSSTSIFGEQNNSLTFNMNYLINKPIKATVAFNLNGKQMYNYDSEINASNQSSSINYILGINKRDNNTSLPNEGYKIISINSEDVTTNNSLIINQNAGGNIISVIITAVELFKKNAGSTYNQINPAYSPITLLNYTYSNFSTTALPVISDNVVSYVNGSGRES